MKVRILIMVFVGLLACVSMSFASVIVDTGDPAYAQMWVYGNASSNQWLAGKFSLGQAYTLTDIYGYCRRYSGTGSNIVVYSDGGSVPGSELFSQGFSVDTTPGWYGLSGLNWNLSAGAYWVAFETGPGDFDGSFGSNVTNQMQDEAFANTGNGNHYDNYTYLSLPVKIDGTPNGVVPEPASMLLFGIGGLATAFLKRRKKIS